MVGFVPFVEKDGGWSGEFCAGGKAHNTDFMRIDVELFGMGANKADRLEGIIDGVHLGFVAISAEAVAKNDGVNTVIIKERDEISAFGADIESVVTSTSG